MNSIAKAAVVVLAIVLVSGVAVVGAFVSTNNTAIEQERGLQAQYDQNKNSYDTFFKKVKEAAQVPAMYAADLKNVYDVAMKDRYGAGGSKALMSWVQEHNPNLDPKLYQQVQQVAEAARESFSTEQKSLLDKKRVYEIYLGQFPRNVIARTLGFPKVKLEDFGIVTSEETEKTFASKKSEPLQLRPD